MKKKQLQEQWAESLKNSASCITINDYQNAERLMGEAMECLNCMKEEYEYYSNPITNFGMLNQLVVENLDEIHTKYPDFIDDWVSLIKEDKNLYAQYLMYTGLQSFDKECDASKFITEAVDIANAIINRATIQESNKSAFKLLEKHELIIPNALTEDESKFYDACQYLLENEKNSLNLSSHSKAEKIASSYLTENAGSKLDDSLSRVNECMASLTKEEYELVESAIGSEEKRKDLFETLKANSIKMITESMKGDDKSDVEYQSRVSNLVEALNKMQYRDETFHVDILKLLELQGI